MAIAATVLSVLARTSLAAVFLVPFIAWTLVYASVMTTKAFALVPAALFGASTTVEPISFFESGICCYAAIFGN